MLKLWQCAESHVYWSTFLKNWWGHLNAIFALGAGISTKQSLKFQIPGELPGKKREGCQRFQLIVILLIKGIKIKTTMWLSVCIFLGKWCICDMKIWVYENMTVAIQLLTVSRAITRTMAIWLCKDLFINYLLSHFRGE